MLRVLECRRTFIALAAIGCLTALGLTGHGDVAGSIAMVAVGLAGANAGEASAKHLAARPPDTGAPK